MLKGSCLRGQVVYQVEKIEGLLVYCYCSFCQKATSLAFFVITMIDKKAFTILEESGKLSSYQSSTGKIGYCY